MCECMLLMVTFLLYFTHSVCSLSASVLYLQSRHMLIVEIKWWLRDFQRGSPYLTDDDVCEITYILICLSYVLEGSAITYWVKIYI